MKKNKTLAFALAATIISAGAFGAIKGTKAIFTDKGSLQSNITIETGTLDVEAVYETEWKLNQGSGNNAEFSSKDLEVILKNAKPGDKIEREFYITNKGTLDLDAVVSIADIDGLNVTLNSNGATNGATSVSPIKEGKSYAVNNLPRKAVTGDESDAVFTIKIEVPTELEDQNNNGFRFNGELITVDAKQKN